MNAEREKNLIELVRRNPFWICLVVFALLSVDYAFRFANLIEQREQLDRDGLAQAQNLGALTQAQQIEGRLEALSIELLQVSRTNPVARQIVQDFNIKWDPNPASSSPVTTPPPK